MATSLDNQTECNSSFSTPTQKSFFTYDGVTNTAVRKTSPTAQQERENELIDYYEKMLERHKDSESNSTTPSKVANVDSTLLQNYEEELFALQDAKVRLESELKRTRKELARMSKSYEGANRQAPESNHSLPVYAQTKDDTETEQELHALKLKLVELSDAFVQLELQKSEIQQKSVELTKENNELLKKNNDLATELNDQRGFSSTFIDCPGRSSLYDEIGGNDNTFLSNAHEIFKNSIINDKDEYVTLLEKEVKSLRKQLGDAWRKWDDEHRVKETLKTKYFETNRNDEAEEFAAHEDLLKGLADCAPIDSDHNAELYSFYADYKSQVEAYMTYANDMLNEYYSQKQKYKRKLSKISQEKTDLSQQLIQSSEQSKVIRNQLRILLERLKIVSSVSVVKQILDEFENFHDRGEFKVDGVTQTESHTENEFDDVSLAAQTSSRRSQQSSPKIRKSSKRKITHVLKVVATREPQPRPFNMIFISILICLLLSFAVISSFNYSQNPFFRDIPWLKKYSYDLVDIYDDAGQEHAFPM